MTDPSQQLVVLLLRRLVSQVEPWCEGAFAVGRQHDVILYVQPPTWPQRLSWGSRGANGQTDRQVEVRMVKIPERWLYSSLSPLLRLVVVGVVVTAISHIKYPYYYHYYSYHHKSNVSTSKKEGCYLKESIITWLQELSCRILSKPINLKKIEAQVSFWFVYNSFASFQSQYSFCTLTILIICVECW